MNFDGDGKIGDLDSAVGSVKLEDGSVIDEGRVLMRHHIPRSRSSVGPRTSGLTRTAYPGSGEGRAVEETLNSREIRTLLFAGANLDQCCRMQPSRRFYQRLGLFFA